MIIVIMGVTASGKTTIGTRASKRFGWRFYDADEFHPPENIAKMSRGEPLTDADREPWLKALHDKMAEEERAGRSAIFACSALKAHYRDILRDGLSTVRFVFLKGDPEVLQARLDHRKGHFMPRTMLPSQIAALEEPGEDEALVLDAARPPNDLVDEIADMVNAAT
jgi:carbohydrate kinase (thermoresistant glucokinase family)